jgi:hypothetical protein
MAKVFNVDSTLENADWIKRGALDIGKVNSIDDVLKFLNISSSASKLPKETIENIMTYNWYKSLPTSVRQDFSMALNEAEAKEKK